MKGRTLRAGPLLDAKAIAAPVVIANGVLEAAKWLALVAMTLDHIDSYALHGSQHWMYQIGRLAMPLFGVVLAAHLAAPSALGTRGSATRMTQRLALFAVLAQIPFTLLRGGPWPPTLLNVLFMLLLVVVFLRLRESDVRWHRMAAWALIAVGGAAVEFWWLGAVLILTTRAWLMGPTVDRTFAVIGAFVLLSILVMSPVPLFAPWIVWLLVKARVAVPRLRHLFYVYYPLHLVVLLALVGRPI